MVIHSYHVLVECDMIAMMWPFRRQKTRRESQSPGPPCPHCGSTNSRLILCHGTDHLDYVRIWRGQRSLTYRCFDCGLDFYGRESEGIADEIMANDRPIDDEEALRAAEEEVRREVEEDDDRRCR